MLRLALVYRIYRIYSKLYGRDVDVFSCDSGICELPCPSDWSVASILQQPVGTHWQWQAVQASNNLYKKDLKLSHLNGGRGRFNCRTTCFSLWFQAAWYDCFVCSKPKVKSHWKNGNLFYVVLCCSMSFWVTKIIGLRVCWTAGETAFKPCFFRELVIIRCGAQRKPRVG